MMQIIKWGEIWEKQLLNACWNYKQNSKKKEKEKCSKALCIKTKESKIYKPEWIYDSDLEA